MYKVLITIALVCSQISPSSHVLADSMAIHPPATDSPLSKAAVDYQAFQKLSIAAYKHRADRLVDLDSFLAMAKDPDTIILDTRSVQMYQRRHLRGAVHLNFSDFTNDKLAKLIPTKNTRILIYCNNNFTDDPDSFALKLSPLALNIPTFINLFGYGYANVYELQEGVSVYDVRLQFGGTNKLKP